jgi:hypothetical protein
MTEKKKSTAKNSSAKKEVSGKKTGKGIKTIKIKGKDYCMVKDRLLYFREQYPNHKLVTRIIEITDEIAILQAEVIDPESNVIADGIAREVRLDKNSFVNSTSYVENCQTSAWGRALGCLGIGIETSIASADEVRGAIGGSDAGPKPVQKPQRAPKNRTADDPEVGKEMEEGKEDPHAKIVEEYKKTIRPMLKELGWDLAKQSEYLGDVSTYTIDDWSLTVGNLKQEIAKMKGKAKDGK